VSGWLPAFLMHPLVVIGGAVTFVNPEPLAPFAEVIPVRVADAVERSWL
jgi:hypothetical protein